MILLRRVAVPLSAAAIFIAGSMSPATATSVTNHTIGGLTDAIGCLTTKLCVAVGTTSNGHASVVDVTNGVGGQVTRVPKSDGLYSISCPTSKGCVAVGNESSFKGPLMVTFNKHGKVSSTTRTSVPVTWTLDRIACVSTKSCELLGPKTTNAIDNGIAIAHWNGKKLSKLHVVKVPKASGLDMEGISCFKTYCVAAGQADVPAPTTFEALLLPIRSGSPGKLVRSTVSTALRSIDCISTSTCYSVGFQQNPAGVVATFHDNKVTAHATVASSLFGIACDKSSCTAVGEQFPSGGVHTQSEFDGDLVTISAGKVSALTEDVHSGGFDAVARVGSHFAAVGGPVKDEHGNTGQSVVTTG
ncbi:MAG TPA: hypothetical protein VME70_16485 [Mycobacteriales bacterium]|nr:hypothetical protein [Mycobacteriales bacterium]